MSFDVIFGPAYKGIPLVTCVSVAWHQLFGEDKDICYNRKEAKDHGEVWELLRCLLFMHATVCDDTVSKTDYLQILLGWMDGWMLTTISRAGYWSAHPSRADEC